MPGCFDCSAVVASAHEPDGFDRIESVEHAHCSERRSCAAASAAACDLDPIRVGSRQHAAQYADCFRLVSGQPEVSPSDPRLAPWSRRWWSPRQVEAVGWREAIGWMVSQAAAPDPSPGRQHQNAGTRWPCLVAVSHADPRWRVRSTAAIRPCSSVRGTKVMAASLRAAASMISSTASSMTSGGSTLGAGATCR